jgi:hypothetical protein
VKWNIPSKSRLAVVGLQRFRNLDDSVCILALFKESYEKTGKSGAGAIQGMAEIVSSLGVFVTKFHAARLVVAKARTA